MFSNLLDLLNPARVWRRRSAELDKFITAQVGGSSPAHYAEYTRQVLAWLARNS